MITLPNYLPSSTFETEDNLPHPLNELPLEIIVSIFKRLEQHDVLQLRRLSWTWLKAEKSLWKIWLAAHPNVFPESAARGCETFREFRQCKENYSKEMTPYDGVTPKGCRIGEGNTETHIVCTRTTSHEEIIQAQERTTGKIVFSEVLYREICVCFFGWTFLDRFIVGHDVSRGRLTVYDRATLKHVNTLSGQVRGIQRIRQESQWIIASFSGEKLLQRWDLKKSLVSSFDLSFIKGMLVQWENEWMLWSNYNTSKSTLINLSNPGESFTLPLTYISFEHYENGFLIHGHAILNRYVKTPEGLDLCWSAPDVHFLHLAGEMIICKLMGRDVVTINPKTGEIEKTLHNGSPNYHANKTFIEGNKLFIMESSHRDPRKLHVIDIATGKKLFHCDLPEGTSLEGTKGDSLIVSKNNQLYTLDPH